MPRALELHMKTILFFLILPVSLVRGEDPDVFEASRNNQTKVISRYLEQKGDPDKRDERGHSLLILAAYNGSAETVSLLLKHGASVHTILPLTQYGAVAVPTAAHRALIPDGPLCKGQ